MANSSKNKTWADLVKIMPFRGIFMVSMVSSFCHLLTSGLVTYWYQRVYFRTEFSIEFQKCPSWVLDLELVFTWQKWSRAQRKGVGLVVRLNLRVPIPRTYGPAHYYFTLQMINTDWSQFVFAHLDASRARSHAVRLIFIFFRFISIDWHGVKCLKIQFLIPRI